MSSHDQLAKLLAPFPAEAIGKLPKPTKRDAPKGKCQECGGYHGLPAVHLDYVGHAAVTKRFLEVDPEWTWEPFAVDASGLPALDREGNLWIKLTICGVTRPGVGDGANMKERIGDALRNAAMRFGVALDLWAKEDISDTISAGASPDHQRGEGGAAIAQPTQRRNVAVRGPEPQASPPQPSALHEALTAKIKGLDDAQKGKLREFCGENGIPLVVKNMSPEQVSVVLDFLRGWEVIAQQFPGVEYAPDDPERPM